MSLGVFFIAHTVEHYNRGLISALKKLNVKVSYMKRAWPKNKIIYLSEKTRRKIPILPFAKSIQTVFLENLLWTLSHNQVLHVNTALEARYMIDRHSLLLTEHGFPDPRAFVNPRDIRLRKMELAALKKIYAEGVPVITISKYSMKMLREKCDVKAIGYIYHGLLDSFRAEKPKTPPKVHRIIYISRLIRYKEPFVILSAMKKLRNHNIELLIRGEGPLRPFMEQYIKKYELRVKFLPRVKFERIPEIIDKASIFVHTCSREPFGLAVLEAMGRGLPVIVPKSGGAMEVAGQAGILFSPGSATSLVDRILSIINDKRVYTKYAQLSLLRSREFTWTRAAKQYISVYRKLK